MNEFGMQEFQHKEYIVWFIFGVMYLSDMKIEYAKMRVEVLSQKSEVISLTKPNIFLLLVSCARGKS